MLFNLFCLRKSFDLGRFFRAYNTTYNFTSLNFFNLFINAIAYGEISVDYINLHLDEDLDVRLKKVIKNTQSKDIHSNSYLTYNSHFPMLFGDYYLKLKFFRIVKDPISLGINKFQQLYYISIFEKFIKKKFFFKIESNFFKECKPKKQIRGIIEFYKDFQMKFLRNLHTSELLEIL
jgi:hypothetical protein